MRRLIVLATTGTLALSACGTSDPPAGEAGDGQTNTIEHAMGSTEVPVDPEDIVVLDTDKIDTLMSLDVTPVAAANADEIELPEYLGDLSDVADAGTVTAPDLETIESLEPDLILGSKFRQEEFYDELSAIAPTVFTELVGSTWKDNIALDGEAIGKGEEAEQLLSDYEARADELGESLGDPSDTEVSIVRFMAGEIRLYGPESFSGIVLEDIGLGRPEAQRLEDADDKRMTTVAEETVDEADGDALFYCAYGEDGAEDQDKIIDGALWKSMDAVESGETYQVNDEIWMTGIGVTAADLIMDDLEEHLAA